VLLLATMTHFHSARYRERHRKFVKRLLQHTHTHTFSLSLCLSHALSLTHTHAHTNVCDVAWCCMRVTRVSSRCHSENCSCCCCCCCCWQLSNLKLTLKFEIEVLFNNLEIKMEELQPSDVLKEHTRLVRVGCVFACLL